MGGMPTGIESLTPRVRAQEGFFGNTNMFLLPSNLKNLQNQRFDVGTSGGVITKDARKMKSFPKDASAMGVASVSKTRPISDTQKLDQEMNEMIEIGGYGKIEPGPKTDITKLSDTMLKIMGTAETRAELEKRKKDRETKIDMDEVSNKVLGYDKKEDAKSFVEQMKKKDPTEDPKIIIDDNLDGENLEDSFETEFEKQYKRLQKYLGADKDEQKGRLALALSDAVGTPGTLADKAAVLNKALLGIATQKKKDKKEIAKLAFAAATDLEGKRITAGKKTSSEKDRERYVFLKGKDKRTKEEELELKALEADLKITKDDTLSVQAALSYSTALDTLKKNLEQIFDKNTTDETEKRILRNRIKSIIAGLRKAGIADDTIKKDLTDYPGASEFFSQGGRVNMANGGATDTPAAPVDTKLNFEQLRTRLPQEITDDIIRLIANNEEALQDFSFIRTQGDVSKFNVKYGVNLVLPQDTV
jgi:hypothetical protein